MTTATQPTIAELQEKIRRHYRVRRDCPTISRAIIRSAIHELRERKEQFALEQRHLATL